MEIGRDDVSDDELGALWTTVDADRSGFATAPEFNDPAGRRQGNPAHRHIVTTAFFALVYMLVQRTLLTFNQGFKHRACDEPAMDFAMVLKLDPSGFMT